MSRPDLLPDLTDCARRAGDAIMAIYAQKDKGAELKGDGSPVTLADTAAEAVILPVLARLTPDIPVVSEENAASHSLAPPKRFWLVDPLDGTKEFIRSEKDGAFTVNIALVEDGQPSLGVVFAPALDRMFTGCLGQGAEEDGQAIRIRGLPASGAVAVASKSHRDATTNAWLERHGISETVSIGSSLKFCLLAAGEADVYPRFAPTMEWDTAAGHAVLAAAGGHVTTTDARAPFGYGKPDYFNEGFIAWAGFRA